MTISERAGFPLAVFAVIGLGVWLGPAVAQNTVSGPTAPTQQECEDAWSSSSASNSCGMTGIHDPPSISVNSSSQCAISVDCATLSGWGNFNNNNPHNSTSFAGTKDEVKRLKNCDGELKVDSCS